MPRYTGLKTATVSVLALLLSPVAVQAQSYPSKSIRIAVGFTAGGPADAMARIIGQKLSELGGHPVIIENRPGAGGLVAGDYVAKSPADGHTAWFGGASGLSFLKHLYAKPLVDAERDLALVTQAVSVPQIFVVHPSLPVRTLAELAQLAKQRPGQLNASIIGPGGSVHLGTELFKIAAGIRMNNVQYKGAANAITDLMGGHIETALFDVPAVIAHLPGGKLRALAVTTAARVKQIPTVPTTAEAGYPDVRSDSWYGIAAPIATAPDLLRRMNQFWATGLRSQDTRDRLYAIGAAPVGSTLEEFQSFRAAESKKWGEVIRRINLKLE
jgi:tripartite-type tricarboxylate transporter receptor subunit TctC